MFPKSLRLLPLFILLIACGEEPGRQRIDLLQQVPADTPYVFVTSRPLPDGLRERLAEHYARQLSAQSATVAHLRAQVAAAEQTAPATFRVGRLLDVLEALFAELEGRNTAAGLRELGIEPVPRSVFYGIGLLPAVRLEVADADRFEALLDRIEQRAGGGALHAELNGQAYRRIDLGGVDAVLAMTGRQMVAGLLPDALFERDLPLLLGRQPPDESLDAAGDVQALIERHGFTGQGEGFVRLDRLVATLMGKDQGRNADLLRALGAAPPPFSDACMRMTEELVAGMPRWVVGVTEADETRLAARGIWESSPAVAGYLQKLAAPVPGVGAAYDGLLAVGLGLDLPQLRNAVDALLRQVIAAGSDCEWVDPASLQAVIPQLNLALGPMTAGIKGFNLQIADLDIDPASLRPARVRAGLLAAVDDPRGILALGAMFNPALAALEIPNDGSLVDLPVGSGLDGQTPPMKVAIKDKALLLLAGADAANLAGPLLNAVAPTPAPLFAVDYGVFRLVQHLGAALDATASRLSREGEDEMAQELRDQLQDFRRQAELFDRLRISVHASPEGLVVDQVMELR